MEPVSMAASITSLVLGCTKIVKLTNDVRQKYRNAPLTIASIATECGTVSVALSQLQWLALSRANSQWGSDNGGQDQVLHSFEAVILGCTLTLSVIEEYTLELLSNDQNTSPFDAAQPSRMARARFVWNEEEMKELLQQLRGHQSSLTLLLTVLQSQSDLQVQELLRNQGEALQNLAERAERSRRRKPPSFLSPRDNDSIFSANDSIISNTTFDFDAEIINSRAYRQVMQNQRRRNAGFRRTNLQPTIEDASDEESNTYVATTVGGDKPDEPDKPGEPQSPPPPTRPVPAAPDPAPSVSHTPLAAREAERPGLLPRQAAASGAGQAEQGDSGEFWTFAPGTRVVGERDRIRRDPIQRPLGPPPFQRATSDVLSEATTLISEQTLETNRPPPRRQALTPPLRTNDLLTELTNNQPAERVGRGPQISRVDAEIIASWSRLMGVHSEAYRAYYENPPSVPPLGPFEIVCEPVYPGFASNGQNASTDANAVLTRSLGDDAENERLVNLMTHKQKAEAWIKYAKAGDIPRMRQMRRMNAIEILTKDEEGRSALYWAAATGNAPLMVFLRSIGMTHFDHDALHVAAKGGYDQVVRLLCSENAWIDWADDLDRTALHWAAFYGHTVVVEVLLEAGAQVGRMDKYGIRPLYLAIANGHEGTARRILAADDGILSAGAGLHEGQPWDYRGMNALHIACRYGTIAIVDMLLEFNSNIYSRTGVLIKGGESTGETVMHLAVQSGEVAMVEHLVMKGALVDEPDAKRIRPLFVAALRGHDGIAQVLLDNGADIHGQTHGKETALHMASSPEVAKLLLQRGAHPDARDYWYNTPVQRAAMRGKAAVVEVLAPVTTNVNTQSLRSGFTPLFGPSISMVAEESSTPRMMRTPNEQRNRFAKIISLLLSAGANIEGTDHSGRTPLLYAVEQGQLSIVEIFLNEGANVNAEDKKHETTLHKAVMRITSHHGTDAKYRPLIRLLLDHGIDVDAVDDKLNTPLHYAAGPGREGAAALLLKAGAAPGDGNHDGTRPLHLAAEGGSHITARLLLDKGADVNARDKQGRTALHSAAEKGHAGVVVLLCNKGVDIASKDKDGKTAMELADGKGHRTVVSALKVRMSGVRGSRNFG